MVWIKVQFYTQSLDDTVEILYVNGMNVQVLYETPWIPIQSHMADNKWIPDVTM